MISEQDLLNEYRKYDYLNEDSEHTFVKILVSYIKPSFLFKSKILTPIQLGRAVEKADSKDGVQSDENLKWLHENCEFNDDFEGGISKHNRRVGFLTGTYWAWKNYDKLGNPEYFGSLGYRRLLNADCLNELEKHDFIVPQQKEFDETLKEQLIRNHTEEYYNMMLDAIKYVYPEEIKAVESYMNRFSGYYAEMYILKKNLFFNFCEWIFKIVRYFIEKYPEFVDAPMIDCFEFTKSFLDEDLIKSMVPPKAKDLRDVAFILERLTGYYLYKLTQSPSLKYREVGIYEEKNKNKEIYKNVVLAQMRRKVNNTATKRNES